jgi:hypothetical protein
VTGPKRDSNLDVFDSKKSFKNRDIEHYVVDKSHAENQVDLISLNDLDVVSNVRHEAV